MTVRPCAPAATIDGKNVSLAPGGSTLNVGTKRFVMLTEIANGSAGSLIFDDSQEKGLEISSISVLIFVIGVTLVWIV